MEPRPSGTDAAAREPRPGGTESNTRSRLRRQQGHTDQRVPKAIQEAGLGGCKGAQTSGY